MVDFEQKLLKAADELKENWSYFWRVCDSVAIMLKGKPDTTPFTVSYKDKRKYYPDTQILHEDERVTMLSYDEENNLIVVVIYRNKQCNFLVDNVLHVGQVVDVKHNEKTDEIEITCTSDDIVFTVKI